MSSSIDATFLLHVHGDEALACRLINQMRDYYPATQIICIADGPAIGQFEEFCSNQRVDFILGDRLRLMSKGGAWNGRMFQTFLARSSARYLIKFDPDCIMHRAFNDLPLADWFGNLAEDTWLRPLMRGGCQGFSRAVAEAIVEQNLFDNPIYCDHPFGISAKTYYGKAQELWYAFVSGSLGDVMHRLGVPRTPWPDVLVHFREPLPDDLSPYAVTHPHD